MFESRAPSAQLRKVGDTVGGEIVDVRRTQTSEYKTNIPEYWQDKRVVQNPVDPATGKPNDPKLQWEITVDTGQPDEDGETERRIFVANKRDTAALKEGVKKSGGRDGMLIGGYLKVTFYGEEDTGTAQPAKLKRFDYQPPAAGEGRRPDTTPVLIGGSPAMAAAARPAPDYPIAKPYSGTSTGSGATYTATAVTPPSTGQTATFDDVPPF